MKYIITFLILFIFKSSFSQNQAIYIPIEISDAYNNKTRNIDGKPGDNYFQNFTDYQIKVKVDTYNKSILAYETINYQNNSKDSLDYLIFDLHQNIFSKGKKRLKVISANDVGKSVSIDSVYINEKLVNKNEFLEFFGTKMKVKLVNKLLPNSNVKIQLKWTYLLATETKIRTGVYDTNTMFIGYWYPQISVYDDIDGWDLSSYDGLHEFYSDFANYYVEIELPENTVAWATGELQNAKNILSDNIYKRYQESITSEKSINIITKEDLQKQRITKKGQNIWVFKADSVSDFAFGISDKYCWDGCTIKLNSSKKVTINTAYNPNSLNYDQTIDIGKNIIRYFSDSVITDYPFPQVSMFNGAGAMEFPMITNIGTEPDLNGILFTQSHEFMHNYFPFLVSSNQKKYAWIDEGLATYLTTGTQKKFGNNFDPLLSHIKIYESYAGKEQDETLITSSHFLTDRSYVINSYFKSCSAFHVLHDLIGDEKFNLCVKDFITNWEYKHPTPYDLFNTFNRVSEEDLNWFWNKWFFQKGYPDLGILDVNKNGSKLNIVIENIGGYPTAILLKIYSDNDKYKEMYINARVWKEHNIYTLDIDYDSAVKIEIGNQSIPDVNKENNVYVFQ